MNRTVKFALGAAAAVAVTIGGVATATATVLDDDGNDVPITGPDLERATAAALAHTGGGRVTDTEIEDEESYYEVEVTLEDGTQIDVQLDESFAVVGDEVESEPDDD